MVSYNSVYLGLLTSILVSSFVRNNPLWFGKSVLKTAEVKELVQSTFTVYTEHPLLDTILNSHVQNELENDLVPYRNHCLRVLSFARFFYQREMNQTTQEPVPHRYIDLMAISLAYHDLGKCLLFLAVVCRCLLICKNSLTNSGTLLFFFRSAKTIIKLSGI